MQMIPISILRAAGLTDRQVLKVLELMEAEKKKTRREQNRISKQNQRSRQQKTDDEKVLEIPQQKQHSRQRNGADSQPKSADTNVEINERFEELWKVYPKRGGASNPKKPARDKFERAVKSGVDPLEIIAAAMRYRDIEQKAGRAGTEKIAQAKTWLNEQRWVDYESVAPELPLELTHGAKHPTGVYVKSDTPEWDAWCRYLGKTSLPTDKAGGWRFDTLWPPDMAPQGAH